MKRTKSNARDSSDLWEKALESGDLEAIDLLVAAGVKPGTDRKTAEARLGPKRAQHQVAKAFFAAIRKGDLKTIQKMVAEGVDPNSVSQEDEDGVRRPLAIAAAEGQREICEFLIKHGADVNNKDGDGLTPLHCAALSGDIKIAELLLRHGADINGVSADMFGTFLNYAAYEGRDKWVKLAFKYKANVHLADGDGVTPLAAVCMQEGRTNLKLARKLLAARVDVNAADKSGYTPLMRASREGKVELIKLLLARKANVHARAERGDTALGEAVMSENPKAVKLLLDAGADPTVADDWGKTALDYAGGPTKRSPVVKYLKAVLEKRK